MSLERWVIGAAIALLGASAVLPAMRRRLAWALTAASTSALVGLLSLRWITTGHPPVFGKLEMDAAEAVVLLATTVVLARRVSGDYFRAPVAAAALTLAHSFLVDPSPTPLTISEQSLWIDLHAPLAYLAWAAYVHAALLSFRAERETVAVRQLGLAFVWQSAMAFVGVYYGSVLFGTAWRWDPIQILGLASWLLTALALHFRLFFHLSLWRQRWLVAVVLAVYVLSAKMVIHLRPGQSFHVFELGSLAGPGVRP